MRNINNKKYAKWVGDNYDKQERNGRNYVYIIIDYINYFYNTNLVGMEYGKAYDFDMYLINRNNQKKLDVEIKIRYQKYDSYLFDYTLLEKTDKDTCVYINICTEGSYVYFINKHKEYNKITKTVVKDSTRDRGYVTKEYYELFKEDCLFFIPYINTKYNFKGEYELESNHINKIRENINRIISEDKQKKKDIERDIFKNIL